jgi:hypothetical protein
VEGRAAITMAMHLLQSGGSWAMCKYFVCLMRARREIMRICAHGPPALCSLHAIPDAAALVSRCRGPVREITRKSINSRLTISPLGSQTAHDHHICLFFFLLLFK